MPQEGSFLTVLPVIRPQPPLHDRQATWANRMLATSLKHQTNKLEELKLWRLKKSQKTYKAPRTTQNSPILSFLILNIQICTNNPLIICNQYNTTLHVPKSLLAIIHNYNSEHLCNMTCQAVF